MRQIHIGRQNLPASDVIYQAFAGNGIGIASTNVYYSNLRQAVIPDAVLGRVLAAYSWLSLGVVPIALLAGIVQSWLGLHWTIVCSVIGIRGSGFWVMIPRVYRIHDLPTPEKVMGDAVPANLESASVMLEPVE